MSAPNLRGKAGRQRAGAGPVPNKPSKPAAHSTHQPKTNAQQQQQPRQKQLQKQQGTLDKEQHKQQRPVTSSSTLVQQLPAADLLQYERKGYLVTRQLLDAAMLQQLKADVQQHTQDHMLAALKQRVRVLCPGTDPRSVTTAAQARRLLQRNGSQPVGFLQFFHLHRHLQQVQQLVHSPSLAGTAAQLLGSRQVRLYQDCVFLKEPGHADTNWHSDLRMAPFDTNSFITAWIPLRNIKGGEEDSGLLFAAGSHRDFALPFWHNLEGRDLGDRNYPLEDTGPMRVGDVSWHHGWTLHCAGPQPPGTPARLALAVSFFADGARLLAVKGDPSVQGGMQHSEDAESYADWVKDLADGAVARHPLLPLVYNSTAGGRRASRLCP